MKQVRIFLLVLGVSLMCFHLVQAADKAVAPEQRPEAGAGFMKPKIAPPVAAENLLPPGIAKREDGFPGQGKHLGLGNGKGLSIALDKAGAPGLEEADNDEPAANIVGGEENQHVNLEITDEEGQGQNKIGVLETKRSIDNAE